MQVEDEVDGAAVSGSVTIINSIFNGNSATSGNDGLVRVWARADNKLLGFGTGHARPSDINGIAFDPKGLTLASGGSDRTARLWNVPGR